MKQKINKIIAWILLTYHIEKSYWRFLNDDKSPLRDCPTWAIQMFIEKMDGQHTSSDKQSQFLQACVLELLWSKNDNPNN